MTLPILIARDVLRQRYRRCLGEAFTDFAGALEPGHTGPAWRWVDTELRPADEPLGGLVLDGEIGVCLYLLPFTPTTQVADQLEQAAGIQGWLEPARDTGYRRADPLGAWRVVVHWMVEPADLDAWVREVSRLRAETEHLETVAVDAVVNRDHDWTRACTDHGFPRLLFTTRSVLRLKAPAEVTAWASADARVRSAVRSLPEACTDERERGLAGEVAAYLDALDSPGPSAAPPDEPGSARPLTALRIRRFRNLDDVTFTFLAEGRTTDAAVIHGPNGTGKSNVFEALSIALSGASERFRRFTLDRNAPATARARRYLTDYLRPVHEPEAEPTVALNDATDTALTLREGEAGHEALAALSGTLLSQEESAAFLEMSAADLGARIVGDASRLADAILEHARTRHEAARREQQAFLREWELSPSIRKASTARERMAHRTLENALPAPAALLAWLETDAFAAVPALAEAGSLAARMRSWQESHELIAIRLAESDDGAHRVDAIAGALIAGGGVLADVRRWLDPVRERIAAWPENLVEEIERWGEWLARPAPAPAADTGRTPAASLTEERSRLEAEQQSVLDRGRRLRARLDHLDRAASLLGEGADPTECPTCGTDLRGRGGAAAALQSVRARLDSEIEACRARYREIAARLKAIEARLAATGELPCPLDANRQAAVLEAVAWLVPEGTDARGFLRDTERRLALGRLVERLARLPELPAWPDGERVDALARETAASLERAFDRIVAVSADEAAWRALRNRLNERLSALVAEHLPATLEALWVELAWNLTPAPWQYRERPGFRVATARQQSVATVSLTALGRSRLARFLLNEAEVRVLGLAWFFVRHLTAGRFVHAFAVLDDPAAQMDGPTFGDLSRLLGAFCRMHTARRIPWMLVVLLNDERRAEIAARATRAVLHRLRWNRGAHVVHDARRALDADWTAPWAGDVVEIR